MKEYCIRRSKEKEWEEISKSESAKSAAISFIENNPVDPRDEIIVVENTVSKPSKFSFLASDLVSKKGWDIANDYSSEILEPMDKVSVDSLHLDKIRSASSYPFLRKFADISAMISYILVVFGSLFQVFDDRSIMSILMACVYGVLGIVLTIVAKHLFHLLVDIADTLLYQSRHTDSSRPT